MEPLAPTDLNCEHLVSPRGLNTSRPRFSWALTAKGRNRRQTAYQIVVGTVREMVAGGHGELWDSGRVTSAETLLVSYGGSPLSSHLRFFWSVRVWDEDRRMSAFAEPAAVETGLMAGADWTAKWIGRPEFGRGGRPVPVASPYDNPYQARPADYLRRPFTVKEKPLRRAVAYATALGLYRLRLNGQEIGDQVLAPGWTDYHKRVEYQVHDVTALLAAGTNSLAAVLGEGWYCGRVGNTLKRQGAHYGPRPAFLCQIVLDYADGERDVVASDATWRAAKGPIVYSDLLIGEKYDARLEQPGWDEASFGDAGWEEVEIVAPWPRPPALDAARSQPVRRTEALPGRFLHRSSTGGRIYDLGQNIAGWTRLALTAPAGATFVLRHGEALTADGDLYTENLRSARATDIYVARGSGRERYEPSFTFHGFRYVEVSGPALDTADIDLTGVQVNSDTPAAGSFSCGSEMVNRLAANIRWSQRGNFLSIPTDCPQRDERLGWLADAQVFWPTASYNMDIAAFFSKWWVDIDDARQEDGAFTDVAPSRPHWAHNPYPPKGAPAWGDGAAILVWTHYCRYADKGLLEAAWPSLVGWMDYIARHNPRLLRENALNRNYGDWLNVGPATPKVMIAAAYWAHLADLMARMASILGLDEDGERFTGLLGSLKAAFREAFVDQDGRVEGDTQTAYLLALDFGLLDEKQAASARHHLLRTIAEADDHLATGFLGVRHLCPVLSDAGAVDLAYRLLLNQTYPSWGFSVANGATTIWERWDGWTPEKGFQTPSMNSFNHYAYGAVGEWLFARVAGIAPDPAAPGFRRVICCPLAHRGLGWAKAEHRAHVGRIAAGWTIAGGTVAYNLDIPANIVAQVCVPGAKRNAIRLDGEPVAGHADIIQAGETADGTWIEIGSGVWNFEWPLDRPAQRIRNAHDA
ncbi:MAG: family 78 glycoside hydrolase catalytic domain [Bauldia sp.]